MQAGLERPVCSDKGDGTDLRSRRFSALTCGSGSGPVSTGTAWLSGGSDHEVARRVFAGTAGWRDARTGAAPWNPTSTCGGSKPAVRPSICHRHWSTLTAHVCQSSCGRHWFRLHTVWKTLWAASPGSPAMCSWQALIVADAYSRCCAASPLPLVQRCRLPRSAAALAPAAAAPAQALPVLMPPLAGSSWPQAVGVWPRW